MGELDVFRTASLAVSGVATTTSTIISIIRRNGIVATAERQRLRDNLLMLRRSEIANYIGDMGVNNLNHLFRLHDLAETKAHRPNAYADALSMISGVVSELDANLRRLARDLG